MKKQNVFNAGLGFGVIMAVFNMCWNLFTADELTVVLIAKVFISGLIGGFIGGLFFGLVMRYGWRNQNTLSLRYYLILKRVKR